MVLRVPWYAMPYIHTGIPVAIAIDTTASPSGPQVSGLRSLHPPPIPPFRPSVVRSLARSFVRSFVRSFILPVLPFVRSSLFSELRWSVRSIYTTRNTQHTTHTTHACTHMDKTGCRCRDREARGSASNPSQGPGQCLGQPGGLR